jgi:electron transport complex protein RnfB
MQSTGHGATHNSCRPYAEAVASGEADINQCPLGGEEGVTALASLLGVTVKPLNADFGQPSAPAVAFIVEQRTRCPTLTTGTA